MTVLAIPVADLLFLGREKWARSGRAVACNGPGSTERSCCAIGPSK
jgi:hypothetical protein